MALKKSRTANSTQSTGYVVTLNSTSESGRASTLRLEAKQAEDGGTSLKMSFVSPQFGAVEYTLRRQTTASGGDTLSMDFVQKKVLARGKLSGPVATDSYSGPV